MVVVIAHKKPEQDFGLGYNSAIDELVTIGNGINALRRIGGSIGQSKWVNNYLTTDYSYADKFLLQQAFLPMLQAVLAIIFQMVLN